jgi:hypothetical protein
MRPFFKATVELKFYNLRDFSLDDGDFPSEKLELVPFSLCSL